MTRILIINTAGMGVGGITTHMLSYLREVISDFPQTSVDIVVTGVRDENMLQQFRDIGCNLIEFPDRKAATTSYLFKLRLLMRRNAYDVLHVHGNSATMALELLCGAMCRISTRIAHCHNSLSGHMRLHKVLGPVFRASYTKAFACSQQAGEWLFGQDGFTVLPNALNLSLYRFDQATRVECRSQLGIQDHTMLMGHIGNFNNQKNQTFVLDVFQTYRNQHNRDAALVFIGIGEKRAAVQAKAERLGLSGCVFFLGIRNDIPRWLQAMDCFVFPSSWEGFGTVIIEAQATGLPALISSKAPEAVKCSENCQFEDPAHSALEWADKVDKLLKMQTKRRIQTHAFSEYDISKTKRILEEAYRLTENGNNRQEL
ncbi:glycosyltransferase [Bifidobacterium eulemuris]|uniref:Eps3J n=1 Tax=Bifidobacterium eulemuris TaxID=1765219 RepID=A0A261G558_9BIFI|nr:glycosyltransferase [Bifidobacterium eulemuris]OZG66570.1 Eps3J [Bifidobacterium eulemuris]QOL32653.1 glycosyltransferase [Bifidobacterium eulemuris]